MSFPVPRDPCRDWRTYGACGAEDPELHHPPSYAPIYQGRVAAAKAVCHRCPVLDECRTWVLGFERGLYRGSRDGVYAAMTPDERVELDDTSRPKRAPIRAPKPRETKPRPTVPTGRRFDPAVLADVARLNAAGLTGRDIATELEISASTAYRMIRYLTAQSGDARDLADAQPAGGAR